LHVKHFLVEPDDLDVARLGALESHTEAQRIHFLVPDMLERQPKLEFYLLQQLVQLMLVRVRLLDEFKFFGQPSSWV